MANQKIQEILGLMQKNLECAICLELLRNPVATNCHHHFCRFCITEFLTTKRYAPCPLCKQPVSKRSLQEKEELSNIVTSIRSLIAAFQEDSGCSFSPPKGPQSFFPCTPESISQKPKIKKGKLKKSKAGTASETTEREDAFCLPEDNKDVSDVACASSTNLGLSPEKSIVEQVSAAVMVTAGLECSFTKPEGGTLSSTVTSNPTADDIFEYLDQGTCGLTGSGCNIQVENTDTKFHRSCQSNQTSARDSKRMTSEDKSFDVSIKTKNVSNASLSRRIVRSLPTVEKENLDSVTTKRGRKRKQDTLKAGLVDSSNSVPANECSQHSSDQSISSTQQFIHPRAPPTKTYSRHGGRQSSNFKVKNWIASLPSSPCEGEQNNNDQVAVGLERETSVQNNTEGNDAYNKGASSADVHRRTRSRTRSSSIRNAGRKDLGNNRAAEGASQEPGHSPLGSNKDLEYCFDICKDSVISNNDEVSKSALPQETEKCTSSLTDIRISVAPLDADNTDILPESPVHDQLILMTPARTRSLFKKQESLGHLTPESPNPLGDPYLFVVGQTPVHKRRRGRPRSKENTSGIKPVTAVRGRPKKSLKLPDAGDNSEPVDHKMVEMHEGFDSALSKNVQGFFTESLCSNPETETEEACEVSVGRPKSVSPSSMPVEEAGLNKTKRISRQKARKAAEKKEEVLASGKERKEAEKLASWIDQAEEHNLLFSTQDAHASLESTDGENVENDIGGDKYAVAGDIEEVDAVCLIQAGNQQIEDGVMNDAGKGDMLVATSNEQDKASRKIGREDVPCETGTSKKNFALKRTVGSCDMSLATPKEHLSMPAKQGVEDVPCETDAVACHTAKKIIGGSFVSPRESKQQLTGSATDFSKAAFCETSDTVLSMQQSCQSSLSNIVHPSPLAAMLPPEFSSPRQLAAKQSRCLTLSNSPSDTRTSGVQMSGKSDRCTVIPSKIKRIFDKDMTVTGEGGTQPLSQSPITRSTRSSSLEPDRLLTEVDCIPVHEKGVTLFLDHRVEDASNRKDSSAVHNMETEQSEDAENKLIMSMDIAGTTVSKRANLATDTSKSQGQERGSTEGHGVPDSSLSYCPASASASNMPDLTDAKENTDKSMERGRLGRQSKDSNPSGDETSEQQGGDTINETIQENSVDNKLRGESAYTQSLLEADSSVDATTLPGTKETLSGCNFESTANGIEYKDKDKTELTQDSSVAWIPESDDTEGFPATKSTNKILAVVEKSLNPEQKCCLCVPSTDLQDQMLRPDAKEMQTAILPLLQEDINFSSSETHSPSQSLLRPARTLNTAQMQLSGVSSYPERQLSGVSSNPKKQLSGVSSNPEKITDIGQNITNNRMKAAGSIDSEKEHPSTCSVQAGGSVKESASSHLPASNIIKERASEVLECQRWPEPCDRETTEEKKKSKHCTEDEWHNSALERVCLEEPSCYLPTDLQATEMSKMPPELPASRKRKSSEVDSLDQGEAERCGYPVVAKCLQSPVYCQSGKNIHSAPSQMTKITPDSDDEDTAIIVRQPTKRKCFSLEGSPLVSRTPLATRRYKSRHARRALSKAFLLHSDDDEESTRKSDIIEDYVPQKNGDENIAKPTDTNTCNDDLKTREELLTDGTNKSLKVSSIPAKSPLVSVACRPAECTSLLSKEVLDSSERVHSLASKKGTGARSEENTASACDGEMEFQTPGSTNSKPKSRRRTKRGLATFENANIITSVVKQFKSPVAKRPGINIDLLANRSPGNCLPFEANIIEKETSPCDMQATATNVETIIAAESTKAADSVIQESIKMNSNVNADLTAGTTHRRRPGENTETCTKQDIHELQNLVSQNIHELGYSASIEQASLVAEGDDETLPPSGFDLGTSNMDGKMPDLNHECTDVKNAPISSDNLIPGDCRHREGRRHWDHQQSLAGKWQTESIVSLQSKHPVTADNNGESEEDEEVMAVKKRRHLPVISDSDTDSQSSDAPCSDEEAPSCQLSSSAVSSQSEILTTQQQQALEADLEQLGQNIAREEARLLQLRHDGKGDGEDRPDPQVPSHTNVPKQAVLTLQMQELRESENEEDENGDRYSARKNVPSPGSGDLVKEQNRDVIDINDDDSNELFPSPLSPSPPPVVKPSLARKDTSLLSRSIFDMDVSEVRSLTKITKLRQVLEFTSDKPSEVPAGKEGKDMDANIQDSPDSEILVTRKPPRIIPESQPSTATESKDLQSQHLSLSPQEVSARLQSGQTTELQTRSPSPEEMSPLQTDLHLMDTEKYPDDISLSDSDCSVRSPKVKRFVGIEERDKDSDSSGESLCDNDEETMEEQNVIYHHGVDRNFDEEPRWQQKKMGFVASSLTAEKLAMLRKLAENYECKVYSKFNDHVTHVIMRAQDDPSVRVCERTLKYFQGVAGRCWVLNFAWVQDSLNKGHLLPEADYEIDGDTVKGEDHHGPRKSRLAAKPLLKGFAFACVGVSPDMSKKEVRQLLQLSGAEVVEDPWYLAVHPANLKLVLRCVDSEAQPVTAAETELFNGQYKHSRLVTVKREWLLDSIGTQTLQPLLFYVCNTCKNLRLPF